MVLVSTLVVSGLLAQPGVWTGYVGGWKSEVPAVRPMVLRPVDPWAQWVAAQNLVAVQQLEQARRDSERRARERALEVQRQAVVEQRLAEEQRAQVALQTQVLQQQLELVRREKEALLERQQREAEAARALQAQQAAEAAQREFEAREKAIAEREAKRLEDARKSGPGPQVHRWVDEDGVVHYSTKPRK